MQVSQPLTRSRHVLFLSVTGSRLQSNDRTKAALQNCGVSPLPGPFKQGIALRSLRELLMRSKVFCLCFKSSQRNTWFTLNLYVLCLYF